MNIHSKNTLEQNNFCIKFFYTSLQFVNGKHHLVIRTSITILYYECLALSFINDSDPTKITDTTLGKLLTLCLITFYVPSCKNFQYNHEAQNLFMNVIVLSTQVYVCMYVCIRYGTEASPGVGTKKAIQHHHKK